MPDYRTELLKKAIPKSAADVGPQPTAVEMKSPLVRIVSNIIHKVNSIRRKGRVKLLWSFFVDKLQCFLTVQYVSAFS